MSLVVNYITDTELHLLYGSIQAGHRLGFLLNPDKVKLVQREVSIRGYGYCIGKVNIVNPIKYSAYTILPNLYELSGENIDIVAMANEGAVKTAIQLGDGRIAYMYVRAGKEPDTSDAIWTLTKEYQYYDPYNIHYKLLLKRRKSME